MVVKKSTATEPTIDDLIGGGMPDIPQQPEPVSMPVMPDQRPMRDFNANRRVMVNRPAFRKPYRRPMGRGGYSGGQQSQRPMPQRNYSQNFTGVVDNRMIPDANLPTETVTGMLEMGGDQHGVLREDFAPGGRDVYISNSQIRRFNLRAGDVVTGPARSPKENERFWGLLKVEKVNGKDYVDGQTRPYFDKLTPIFPDERLTIETTKSKLITRVIDLVAPIGKGQRGLIVSPPKAGKTTVLKDIAEGIAANYPDVILMAVLVGERPEEVTDIRKHVKGEVAASNFDEPAQRQTQVAELALERAKRLVESGKDVVILLDSITRLARAYNLAIPTSGRTLSGGFDPVALYPPKRFFGAARNFEDFKIDGKAAKASLTILGTALVDTGSRMDELIYEEFKGTGNMELHLSRKLAERRVYPAIDIRRSGTRQEQLLFKKDDYEKIVTMRRMIDVLDENEATEVMLERIAKTKDNKEFLASLGR
jgi:transcription termination factor Rho